MRQYRAIPIDGKDFVYGWYVSGNEKHYIVKTSSAGFPTWYEVIPETVGQQVGLKDKNSKEIYEGDIVKIADGTMIERPVIGKVIWFNLSWQLEDGCMLCVFHPDCIEIIGNIHTTPKLLEQDNG